MPLFVGIDGGGTRAVAVAADGRSRELSRVEGGAMLARIDHPAEGVAAISDLVERASRAAGGSLPVDGLCCALAGAGRDSVRRQLAAALYREAVATRIRLTTDADAAFYDAFDDGPGVLLIAGTGSIALGRAADGRNARVGGWGSLLGDDGSGYAIGRAALRAVMRAHDGRGEATMLREAVLRQAGVADPEELVARLSTARKATIGAFAPLVFEAAERGDRVAGRLSDDATRDLAAHVAALIRRLEPWNGPPRLALAGGVIAPGRLLREAVLVELGRLGVPCDPVPFEPDAAWGAAMLAQTLTTATPGA